jgi:hypothetical protein
MIATQHYDLNTAITQLQISIDKLTDWYSKWKLTLNTTKTEAKIFTLRRLHQNIPNISIQNTQITWTPKDTTVKYLGLHLDTRLNWNTHINKTLNKAYTRLYKLYPLINRKSPLKHECTTLLYKSLIRPIITYSSPVWFGTSNTNFKKLQRLQNKIIRISLNAPWFTRNTQIHRETNTPTLKDFITTLTLNFHARLPLVTGAQFYNIGQTSIHPRLKLRLSQDILNL